MRTYTPKFIFIHMYVEIYSPQGSWHLLAKEKTCFTKTFSEKNSNPLVISKFE